MMTTSAQSSASPEIDSIVKVKAMMPGLRDKLTNVMTLGGQIFYQNSQMDNCLKTGEQTNNSFDKALEDFFHACSLMEMHLKTAIDVHVELADSKKHTPFYVQNNVQPEPPPNTEQITYGKYLEIVQGQINCAKEIYDMLADVVNKQHPMRTEQRPAVQSQGSMPGGGGAMIGGINPAMHPGNPAQPQPPAGQMMTSQPGMPVNMHQQPIGGHLQPPGGVMMSGSATQGGPHMAPTPGVPHMQQQQHMTPQGQMHPSMQMSHMPQPMGGQGGYGPMQGQPPPQIAQQMRPSGGPMMH